MTTTEPDGAEVVADLAALIRLIPEELVRVADLKPHPRNYQAHPQDQIDEIKASIRQFGVFKNVVVARDSTILAGHGTVEALEQLGVAEVPARRLDLDPFSPDALKVVALDNELNRFAERNDRALTELLKEVSVGATGGLEGTGYNEMILANLLMVTRPMSEVRNADAAAEWVGMPDYEPEGDTWKLSINFASSDDRDRFLAEFDLRKHLSFSKFATYTISAWWPLRDDVRHDGGLRWSQEDDQGVVDESEPEQSDA